MGIPVAVVPIDCTAAMTRLLLRKYHLLWLGLLALLLPLASAMSDDAHICLGGSGLCSSGRCSSGGGYPCKTTRCPGMGLIVLVGRIARLVTIALPDNLVGSLPILGDVIGVAGTSAIDRG